MAPFVRVVQGGMERYLEGVLCEARDLAASRLNVPLLCVSDVRRHALSAATVTTQLTSRSKYAHRGTAVSLGIASG